MRSAAATVLVLALVSCAAAGCEGPTEITATVEDGSLEVVLEIPGAPLSALAAADDGTLFAASPAGLFRSALGARASWQMVAEPEFYPIRLYAASASSVFLLGQVSGSVFKWSEGHGIREMRTVLTDSVIVSDHAALAVPLIDLWGRGPDDVYAVGFDAAILHYDGVRWTPEPNPLVPLAKDPSTVSDSYRAHLWRVAGDADRAYVLGTSDVLEKRGDAWRVLEPGPEIGNAAFRAAVAVGDAVILAGGPTRPDRPVRIYRVTGGAWNDLGESLAAFRDEIVDGRAQPNGCALFWGHATEVAEVCERRTTIYHLPALRSIRGAVIVGEHLYAGGRVGNSGAVVRLTRP